EGGAALVLERFESAAKRGVDVQGEVLGASVVMDANHLPDPQPAGECRAMFRALDDAGLAPAEIDYVNAHGTSTPLGDRTECMAIRDAFGSHSSRLWVN